MCYIKFNLKFSLPCAFLNQILYLCNKVATIATNINIEGYEKCFIHRINIGKHYDGSKDSQTCSSR